MVTHYEFGDISVALVCRYSIFGKVILFIILYVTSRGKLCSLLYSSHTRKLVSSDDDGKVGVWDMSTDRQETAEWAAGSCCEKCSIPFFWNVKQMWAQKTVGVRQVREREGGGGEKEEVGEEGMVCALLQLIEFYLIIQTILLDFTSIGRAVLDTEVETIRFPPSTSLS